MSVNVKNAGNSQVAKVAMTRRIAVTAVFTALAVVLMYLEIQLPFMPPFLKFDFSEIPVLVGAFALGPVNGVIIELLKNRYRRTVQLHRRQHLRIHRRFLLSEAYD